MCAELLEHAYSPAGVPEGDQFLAQDFRANRRAIGLRQLGAKRYGNPSSSAASDFQDQCPGRLGL
jgi:hypothetical protein